MRVAKINGVGSEPEHKIIRLAKTGKLLQTGQRAIAHSHKLGLSVTVVEGVDIISIAPDGSKMIIGKSKKASGKTYPTGKWRLG